MNNQEYTITTSILEKVIDKCKNGHGLNKCFLNNISTAKCKHMRKIVQTRKIDGGYKRFVFVHYYNCDHPKRLEH